jgi:hypothetical protein
MLNDRWSLQELSKFQKPGTKNSNDIGRQSGGISREAAAFT